MYCMFFLFLRGKNQTIQIYEVLSVLSVEVSGICLQHKTSQFKETEKVCIVAAKTSAFDKGGWVALVKLNHYWYCLSSMHSQ